MRSELTVRRNFLTHCAAAVIAAAATSPAGQPTPEQRAELAGYFGFGPMQIYRLKPGITELQIADLDLDGRSDIALWNAWQNRVELFYQSAEPAATAAKPADSPTDEQNEVPDRGNMRRANVPLAYRVGTLRVGEFTGDKRPDLVFFGEPRDLVILPGKDEGGFGPPLTTATPEGDPSSASLTIGDFNHDGRTDVALKGEEQILIFHQEEGGGLRKPERLVHGVAQAGLLLTTDLDGDGRDDLLLGAEDDQYGLLAFRQTSAGRLGPLERLRVPRTRSITIPPKRAGHPNDIFTVEAATGRLRRLQWGPADGEQRDWPLKLFSYPIFSRSKQRPVDCGDVTGDGLPDVVAADPDSAQFVLFRGSPAGLEPGVAFPGLLKTGELQIADIDGDGKREAISLSTAERTVGVSRYDDGRMTFPEPREIQGEPLAFRVGSLDAAGKEFVTAVLTRGGEGDDDKQHRIQLLGPDGAVRTKIALDKLEDDPGGLRFADVDQDGRNDLLLFVKFAPLRAILQQDGTWAALSGQSNAARAGLVKDAAVEDFALGDPDGDGKPEVLLAQKNLARALIVRDGQWQVKDQFNPESTDAKLKGIALLPGASGPVLLTYDQTAGALLEMRRRADGTFGVAHLHRIGTFELSALLTIGASGSTPPGVLLADVRRLALVTPTAELQTLLEQDAYETDIKDAWLADSVVGDFNGDGIRDVAAIDMRKANIEILTTMPDGKLTKATHFQVFQGKRFSGEPERGGEPRQVLAGDVTGDKRDDLVVIVHDRLIIYPGE